MIFLKSLPLFRFFSFYELFFSVSRIYVNEFFSVIFYSSVSYVFHRACRESDFTVNSSTPQFHAVSHHCFLAVLDSSYFFTSPTTSSLGIGWGWGQTILTPSPHSLNLGLKGHYWNPSPKVEETEPLRVEIVSMIVPQKGGRVKDQWRRGTEKWWGQ